MNGVFTKVYLNVFPLGSSDDLISMDSIERNQDKVECYTKTIECIDEEGNPMVVNRIPKVFSVRNISSM